MGPLKNGDRMENTKELTAFIESSIITLPGRPAAMLDSALAEIYETKTRSINQALKRNKKRFPKRFYFKATSDETKFLRRKGYIPQKARYAPHLFTREGANVLSGSMRGKLADRRAVQMMDVYMEYRRQMEQANKLSKLEILKLALSAEEERLRAEKKV